MSRLIKCAKFGKELPGLEAAPMKGELGQRVYNEVSKEAWDLWVKHQTMVINEYRINPSEEAGQEILQKQLHDFFWGEGAELPPDYVAPQEK